MNATSKRGRPRVVAREDWKLAQYTMHPEIHKLIKIAAIQEGMSGTEWIHHHFSKFFGRHDLASNRPSVAASA